MFETLRRELPQVIRVFNNRPIGDQSVAERIDLNLARIKDVVSDVGERAYFVFDTTGVITAASTYRPTPRLESAPLRDPSIGANHNAGSVFISREGKLLTSRSAPNTTIPTVIDKAVFVLNYGREAIH